MTSHQDAFDKKIIMEGLSNVFPESDKYALGLAVAKALREASDDERGAEFIERVRNKLKEMCCHHQN